MILSLAINISYLYRLLLALALIFFWFMGSINAQTKPILVLAGAPPYASLAQDIGGDLVQASALIEQQVDPHFFELLPSQLAAASRAQLYIYGALEIESQLLAKFKSINPDLIVINVNRGLDLINAAAEHDHEHDQQTEQTQSKIRYDHNELYITNSELAGRSLSEFDAHSYFSPELLSKQADNIFQALVKLLPEQEDKLADNLKMVKQSISKIDAETKRALAPFQGRALFFYHSLAAYFTRQYGLQEYYLSYDHSTPSPSQLIKFIANLNSSSSNYVLITSSKQKDELSALAPDKKYINLRHFYSNWQETIINLRQAVVEALAQ